MSAVASVIKNRTQSGEFPSNPKDVVLQPNQFSAWNLPKNDKNNPAGFNKADPDLQRARDIVESVWNGDTQDQTNGATYYGNIPLIQQDRAANNRPMPEFTKYSQTAQIGHHTFYAGANGPVTPDLLSEWGSQPKAISSSVPAPADEGPDLLAEWGSKPGQASGDPDVTMTPQGVPRITIHPQGYTPPSGPETTPQWLNRQIAQSPDDLAGTAERLGLGAVRGVGDVADTIAQGIAATGTGGANLLANAGVIAPGTNAAVQNWGAGVNQGIVVDRNNFDAVAANSPAAQVGRVGGQIIGTAPLLGAGGAAIEGATGIGAAAGPVESALMAGTGAGAGASALTSSASDEPLGNQIAFGGLTGAAMFPAGYAASALGAGLRRGIFGAASPETAQLAQTARNQYGIPVTAGQISSNPMMRFADSVLQRLPFSGYGARTAEQQSAFNRGVAQTFGENTDTVNSATINRARDRIGTMFDSVAARTPVIQADQPFYQHLGTILNDARSVLPQSEIAPLENQMRDLLTTVDPQTHTFSGETYQALTRKGAPLDRAIQSKDPNVRYYAAQVREALDDAMQRSAPQGAQDDLLEARRQWRALKTVEPIATPKKAPTGDIRPALLATQAAKSYPRGNGPLSDLAAIGQRFLTEPPSSGTSERLLAMKLGATALGAAGIGGAAYEIDPENFQRNAALGIGALAGGRALSAVLRSHALANSLIRSGMGGGVRYPSANLLSRAAPAAALTYRNANAPSGQ
jgi:hypothetical protein